MSEAKPRETYFSEEEIVGGLAACIVPSTPVPPAQWEKHRRETEFYLEQFIALVRGR